MSNLRRALEIAVEAHNGQVDRAGRPYICHAVAVMRRLEGETAQICGVLHDVIRDSDWTLNDLRNVGFSDEVLFNLECLTKRRGEDYWHYLDRAMTNDTTCRVKLADLEDDMDPRRGLPYRGRYEDARKLVLKRLRHLEAAS